jgi:tetratricopeptide (TPR) repeat protein
MMPILQGTLAALTLISTVALTAPATADDFETCSKASGREAIAACTRAIDTGRYSGRRLAGLLTNRCAELPDVQENDKAIEDCSKAIQIDPNIPDAYSNRGHAYFAKGQYDRAIDDLNEAVRLSPDDAEVLNNRGLAYSDSGRYDRAIDDFDHAIRLSPKLTPAFYNRGNAYRRKGQYDRSIEDYDSAVRLDANYTEAFFNRGISWERKGDLQRALADFNKVSEIAPSDPDAPKAIERVTKALSGRR